MLRAVGCEVSGSSPGQVGRGATRFREARLAAPFSATGSSLAEWTAYT